MSRAGNELAVVQTFARHSPSMILRYLRDAVLGFKGGNIRAGHRGGKDKEVALRTPIETLDAQLTFDDLEARVHRLIRKKLEEEKPGASLGVPHYALNEVTNGPRGGRCLEAHHGAAG